MSMEKATFAGGCFWCQEALFHGVYGVVATKVGYVNGYEAIEISFDSEKVTFLQLLGLFWRQIDPLDAGGQFYDRGHKYETVIFYGDAQQQRLAEMSKGEVQALFGDEVMTKILPLGAFERAEEAHQLYCMKQPEAYSRFASGHDLKAIWQGKYWQGDLKEKLTREQYYVTQEQGTEPPFENAYWNWKQRGLYLDVISGEPLFSSEDKFDSGTGWPSFTRALTDLIEGDDGTGRIEVKAPVSGAHLGHLFPDGPPPSGLRYCINSAALLFVSK